MAELYDTEKQLLPMVDPHFYTIKYKVNAVNTHNTLTISYDKFVKIFQESKNGSFYLCIICHISSKRQCIYCTPFLQYPRTFILETPKRFYCMPQPSLYTKKNHSYFQSIIWFIHKVHNNEINNIAVPHNLQYPQRLIYRQAPLFRIPKHIIDMEHLKYYQFINDKFKGGSLMQQKSGKLSYMRTRILGVNASGIRMTLTIDNSLGPNDVSIPQHMLDSLDLACPYVIINRDPSINDCAIYSCELLGYENKNDNTIHVNPFVLEGLHADQDGDDLNVYYLKHENEVPSLIMLRAITELLQFSWKYGRRRNICNQSRFSLGQYHLLLLQVYDKYFQSKSKIWKTLSSQYNTTPKRANVLMQLGCTIWRDEVDEFLEQLRVFGIRIRLPLITFREMINGSGMLLSVIESGAKGSMDHVKMFTDILQERVEIGGAEYVNNLRESFNNYVNASKSISLLGQQLFILLSIFQPLYLLRNDIYMKNDTRIICNVSKCPLFNLWIYQIEAITLVFEELLKNCESDEMESVVTENIYDDNEVKLANDVIDRPGKKLLDENYNISIDQAEVRYFDSNCRCVEVGNVSNFIAPRPRNVLYSIRGNYVSPNLNTATVLPMLYGRLFDYISEINSSDELQEYLINDSLKIIPILAKLPDNYKKSGFRFVRILN
ncbi:viral RNA polymerase subunit lef-9 [Microplitis demolitor]|uniref:uncharacterized protein LOC103570277 n=1 Tax=Microplitis demolitor TaxID=69319 RepID=UPI00043FFEB0|nr:uncharacterized protein LOC103570277 [Microplitis demolitor]KAG6558459.1 viral RNA polymerase subunit lef-9 [Microplitis demolitor]